MIFGMIFGMFSAKYLLKSAANGLHLLDAWSFDRRNYKWLFIAGMVIGAMFFMGIYGTSRINPTNDGWLYDSGADLAQHYFGWRAYRASAWGFPLCLTDKLSYPIATSIIFMDSIPLWAVFFKIFSPILPSTFQYFGLFGLVTFMLQGGFAVLLLKKMECSLCVSLIGAAIFCFMPTLIQRMFYHTSLASQWIILAALVLWLLDREFKRKHTGTVLWCVLGAACVVIHMYLLVAFTIILISRNIELLMQKANIKQIIIGLSSPFLSVLLTLWVFGSFVGSQYLNLGMPNYYVSNINSLFDGGGWSRFLPDLAEATGGTYEGLAYLGLGVLTLCVVTLSTVLINLLKMCIAKTARTRPFSMTTLIKEHPRASAFVFCCVVSLLLSWGSSVTFFDKRLFTYPLPTTLLYLWGIFRATGRFVWVAMYIITASVIVFVSKHFIRSRAYILIIVFLLQLIDLSPFSRVSHVTSPYASPLSSAVWMEFQGYSHMYLGDRTVVLTRGGAFRNPITKLAFDKDMTVNDTYFARRPKGVPAAFSLDSETLYVFTSEWDAFPMPQVYEINGLFVTATSDTQGNFFDVMNNYPNKLCSPVFANTASSPGIEVRNATIGEDGYLYTDGVEDFVLYGPYAQVKSGTFDFTLHYEVIENNTDQDICGIFDVSTNSGRNVIQAVAIRQTQTTATISGVTFDNLSESFEHRVYNIDGVKLKIISVEISYRSGENG